MSTVSPFAPNKSANTLSKPTPYQLRALVLDYLCHNCYSRTARTFAKDSSVQHLDPDGNEITTCVNGSGDDSWPVEMSDSAWRQVELREDLRTEIMLGHVDTATDLLNKHFPTVLDPSNTEPNIVPTPPARPTTTVNDHVSQTSYDPAHLSLNLRILAFSEACRTRPLEYIPRGRLAPSVKSQDQDVPLVRPPSPSVTEQGVSSEQLLAKAQKLYAFAQSLPNAVDQQTYLKELANVSGLLAYKIPETSSVAKYLSLERREAVADQINRAILKRCGKATVSFVELLIRYTCVLCYYSEMKSRPGSTTAAAGAKAEQTVDENSSESVIISDLLRIVGPSLRGPR